MAANLWMGVDGPHWFRVSVDNERYHVKSNATREDFSRLFRLSSKLSEIESQIIRNGPELSPFIAQLPGLRLLRPWSATEMVFCFLCTPNNHLSRITQMVRSLSAMGNPIEEVEGLVIHEFPSVETIAAIEEHELRSRGFGYRATTIPNVAKQVIERGGSPWLESLRTAPFADARSSLMGLKGIGPKLADCMALFALHHTEAVPVDTHLWQAAVRLYFPEWNGKSLTSARYDLIGEHLRGRFGELAGWAHQYLFYDNLLNWRSRRLYSPTPRTSRMRCRSSSE